MNRCKVCKCDRKLVLAQYHLGRKYVWECKCGKRLYKRGDEAWYQLTKAQRIELGIEEEEEV